MYGPTDPVRKENQCQIPSIEVTVSSYSEQATKFGWRLGRTSPKRNNIVDHESLNS